MIGKAVTWDKNDDAGTNEEGMTKKGRLLHIGSKLIRDANEGLADAVDGGQQVWHHDEQELPPGGLGGEKTEMRCARKGSLVGSLVGKFRRT